MRPHTEVLSVHSSAGKLAHYVRMRVNEAIAGLSYRAGTFAPASYLEAVFLDLALICDAVSVTQESEAETAELLDLVFRAAAKALASRHPELDAEALRIRIQMLHDGILQHPSDLSELVVVVQQVLLRAFGSPDQLSYRQRKLRQDLALVLALEADVVRTSVMGALGADVDLTTLVDDRDQHLYLFCDRYGALNKAEVGEEIDAHSDEHEVEPPHNSLKRLMDISASFTILALLSPLLLFIYVAVMSKGGPVFYAQRRIGRRGKVFKCWKFRTMVPNAEKLLQQILATDPVAAAEFARDYKLTNDPRITPIGQFLRKTSLDELPQIFNVLTGDMSLVGPRPMAVEERDRWGAHFRVYKSMRPGLTGPWQLYCRNDAPYHTRFTHVVKYANEWSLWKDIGYLIETVAVPFRQHGAR